MKKYVMYQQVKMEYQKHAKEAQRFPIMEWKWEDITMDFLLGLPRGKKGSDAIRVIVDRLTNLLYSYP
jgi:hypothetical protein